MTVINHMKVGGNTLDICIYWCNFTYYFSSNRFSDVLDMHIPSDVNKIGFKMCNPNVILWETHT